MGTPTGPNIGVTASAGNVKVVMTEVQKELDRIKATPLEQLRDKSEEALEKVNQSIGDAVRNLGTLKTAFANTGTVDTRKLKATEKQFAALKNLGVDPRILKQIDSTLGEVTGRGTRDERAKQLKETRSKERAAAVERANEERSLALKSANEERAAAAARVAEEERREREARSAKAKALRKDRAIAQRDAIRGIQEEVAAKDRAQKNAARREFERGGSDGGKTTAGGGGGGGLQSFAGALDDLTGGRKFDLKKGAKFGIAGLIGGFVADTLAQATAAAVEQKRLGDQGGLSDASFFGGGATGEVLGITNAVGRSLPIFRGVIESFENIHELATGVRQEAEEFNKTLELQNRASEYANTILKERKRLQKENARQLALDYERENRSVRGGREGRVQAVNIRQVEETSNLGARRDETIRLATEEAKKLIDENKARINALRNQKGRDGKTSAAALSQITGLETSNKLIGDARDGQIADANKLYEERLRLLTQISERNRNIALGAAEDTRAVDDQIDSLKRARETMAGDPLVQARNEFLELKPTIDNLRLFDEQAERYVKRLEEVRRERQKFDATEGAKSFLSGPGFIGGNAIEQEIGRLRANNVDESIIASVKVRLETDEAKRQAEEFKRTLQEIGGGIRITLARTSLERIREEVEAENRKRIADTGVGYTRQQLDKEIKARQIAGDASAAAQTRENAKTAEQRRDEALESLKRQGQLVDANGNRILTDQELRFGVNKTLQDYAASIATSRPQLITSDDKAAADEFAATRSGKVIDAENPILNLQREATGYLKTIADRITRDGDVPVDISR
jgi:hypothetical protein